MWNSPLVEFLTLSAYYIHTLMIFTFKLEWASRALYLSWLSAVVNPVAVLELLLEMLFFASGSHCPGFPPTSQAALLLPLYWILVLSLLLNDGVPSKLNAWTCSLLSLYLLGDFIWSHGFNHNLQGEDPKSASLAQILPGTIDWYAKCPTGHYKLKVS